MQKQKWGVSLIDYRIFETEEFTKKLNKLSPKDKSFIQNKLTTFVYPQIKQSPWFGNNLKKSKRI